MILTPALMLLAVAVVAFPAAVYYLWTDWRAEQARRRRLAILMGA